MSKNLCISLAKNLAVKFKLEDMLEKNAVVTNFYRENTRGELKSLNTRICGI